MRSFCPVIRLCRPTLFLAYCIGLAAAVPAGAQQVTSSTSGIFARYAPYVIKIQVVETGSGAKARIGSGFFTTAAGHVVTNYHVISSLINHPDRYRVELVEPNGTTLPATVVAIDVVHDLAVLTSTMRGKPFFTLRPVQPVQGQRLFSLGNPKDLGLGIVEGTYNGLLEHTLYPRIHLTASLNPGMSGGPTIDEQGHVIGINVSTEGNQISFLVPVDRASDLLASALSGKGATPSLQQVASQLRSHQDAYLKDIIGTKPQTIAFGPFRVVTQPAAFFRCWGDVKTDPNKPYEISQHRCATDDDVYLDDDQSTGALTLSHQLITTKTLNASRFYSQYATTFTKDNSPSGTEEYVTNWNCVTRNVRNGDAKLRTIFCVRRYRKLPDLYDAHLKAAVLGRANVGLVSTLNVTGVTFDNINVLADRFLRQITWR